MGRTKGSKTNRDLAREVPLPNLTADPQPSLLSLSNPASAPEPRKKEKPKSFSTAMSKRKRTEKEKGIEHAQKLEMKKEKKVGKREGRKKAKTVWD
ncbi:hypothetical protein BT69DRAFT_1335402 [Atractiella rhizophila]|nr:hypothetical protein BT69DRAFT_1335402 [Atractiella rhizophila]